MILILPVTFSARVRLLYICHIFPSSFCLPLPVRWFLCTCHHFPAFTFVPVQFLYTAPAHFHPTHHGLYVAAPPPPPRSFLFCPTYVHSSLPSIPPPRSPRPQFGSAFLLCSCTHLRSFFYLPPRSYTTPVHHHHAFHTTTTPPHFYTFHF